jgi:glycosyltransferase involved in cell wall biosynthesis
MALVDFVQSIDFAYIVVNYWWYADFLTKISTSRKVIITHDVWSQHIWRDNPKTPVLHDFSEEREFEELSKATDLIAISEEDQRHFAVRHPRVHRIAPKSLFRKAPEGSEVTKDNIILFVGSKYAANVEGIKWFIDNCVPLIRASTDSFIVRVAGSVIEELQTGIDLNGIELLGIVENLQEEYDKASIVIVPILSGTGVKIKLIDALASGKAVVTTTPGISGFSHCLRKHLMVRDGGIEFAETVSEILSDSMLRNRLEVASRRAYEDCLKDDCEQLFADTEDLD